jgi:hypothetical protein
VALSFVERLNLVLTQEMAPIPPSPLDIPGVCQALAAYRYNFQNEATLQAGIAQVLERSAVVFKREAVLDVKSRPDFLLGSVVIEVKIKGSVADFLRQANRYPSSPLN